MPTRPSRKPSQALNPVTEAIVTQYEREWRRIPPSAEEVDSVVRDRFGHGVKPIQCEATRGILAGKDVLTHAPTGYGKTLIIMAPSLWRPGSISVVISPLILLQRNQVRDKNFLWAI